MASKLPRFKSVFLSFSRSITFEPQEEPLYCTPASRFHFLTWPSKLFGRTRKSLLFVIISSVGGSGHFLPSSLMTWDLYLLLERQAPLNRLRRGSTAESSALTLFSWACEIGAVASIETSWFVAAMGVWPIRELQSSSCRKADSSCKSATS